MKNRLFSIISVLTIAAALLLTATAQNTNLDDRLLRLKTVKLPCANPGGHQDVAKTPYISNNTGQTLKKGTRLSWTASDGDKGQMILNSDLAAGASVAMRGHPGQNYTCQAWTIK
jgi:hypothetical protein